MRSLIKIIVPATMAQTARPATTGDAAGGQSLSERLGSDQLSCVSVALVFTSPVASL